MSQKIAVIADIHLSNISGTVQEAALVYSLEQLKTEDPDIVLFIGDITIDGTIESANFFCRILHKSGLCFRMIPGNSDERTPDSLAAVTAILTVNAPFYGNGYAVCLLDIHNGKVGHLGKEYLKKLIADKNKYQIVIGSHYPLEVCMEDPYIRSVIEAGEISLFIGGHVHYDQEYKIGETSIYTVRGIDPDKAIGAPPAVAVFELREKKWTTYQIPFRNGTVVDWPSYIRNEFIDYLGFSCMSNSLEGLQNAALHNVQYIELRSHNALSVPEDKLFKAVQLWRNSGGKGLCMHMPDISYDNDRSIIIGVDDFRSAVSLAMNLKVERMTLHVPRISVKQIQENSKIWNSMANTFLELIKEPIAKNIIIGVENLHMSPGEHADNSRGFGYLPAECHDWVTYLRKASGYCNIGIHLDIGHARNNIPFSSKYSLGKWYALIGKEVNGYHLHQVILTDNKMKNHYPITDVYGPLISLSSFFWCWKTGILCHAPMYLEIRSDNIEDTVNSIQYIRQYVSGKPLAFLKKDN